MRSDSITVWCCRGASAKHSKPVWLAQGEVVTVSKENFTLAAGGRVLAARTQVHVLQQLSRCVEVLAACAVCRAP